MKIKIILCGIMMAAVMLTGCTKAPQHPLQEIETEEAQIDGDPFFAVNADSGEVDDEDLSVARHRLLRAGFSRVFGIGPGSVCC